MTDQEILDALRRKLEYNRKCQHVNEREAKEAQARADLSARICAAMEQDIKRLEARIEAA